MTPKPSLKTRLTKNLTNKHFWISNLKTLALMLVIVLIITQYQQRNMTTGKAPVLDNIDYINGPSLVYFWGSWCPICQTTSPSVSTLAEENEYQIISIALSSGSDRDIQSYQQEHEYTFKTINDNNGQISQQWGVEVTPSFFIINKEGEITSTSTGMTSLWGMKFRLWL